MTTEICLAFIVGFALGFIAASWNNRQPRLKITECFRDADGSGGMTTYEGSPRSTEAARVAANRAVDLRTSELLSATLNK